MEWRMEPETEEEIAPAPAGEMHPPQTEPDHQYTSENSKSDREYYMSLVSTSIAKGGRFGGYEISVWWLRTILAGLEGKESYLEAMWKGSEYETGYAGSESIDDVFT